MADDVLRCRECHERVGATHQPDCPLREQRPIGTQYGEVHRSHCETEEDET